MRTESMDQHKEYEHQVAGSHSSSVSQLLRGEYGKVLKPYKVQLNSCTTQDFSHSASQHNKGSNTENDEDAAHEILYANEWLFYESLKDEPELAILRALMPAYYGQVAVTVAGIRTPYLVLEDLTLEYRSPCVADIKMGDVDTRGKLPHRRLAQQSKYPSLREVGWCITGMKQHNVSGEIVNTFGPDEGRCLTTQQVHCIFQKFLQMPNEGELSTNGKMLVRKTIEELNPILQWFRKQRQYWFRSSSLLVVYDAEHFALRDTSNCENKTQGIESSMKHLHSDERGDHVKQISSELSENDNRSIKTAKEKTQCLPTVEKCLEISESPGSSNNIMKSQDNYNSVQKSPGRCQTTSNHQSTVDGTAEVSTGCDRKTADSAKQRLENISPNPNSIVRVKMIDFAHVLGAEDKLDDKYIRGLENILSFLESLLNQVERKY